MPCEHNRSIKPEERRIIVLTTGATDQALEMEALAGRIEKVANAQRSLQDQVKILAAQRKQADGSLEEIQARFWSAVREDNLEWFNRMEAGHLRIHFRRGADEQTDAPVVILEAVDMQEQAMHEIKRIFFDMQGSDDPSDG